MRYRGAHRGGALWLVLLLVVLVLDRPDRMAADLMGDIQQSLQSTGKLFGINTIADVADLVAKGFANRRGPQETPKAEATESVGGAEGLLTSRAPSMMMMMMKLLGLDGNQLGAMLVNGIVFLAHIIGTNLGAFQQKPALDTAPASPFLREPPPAFGKPADGATGAPQTDTNDSGPKPNTATGASPLEWLLRNPSRQFRVLLDQVQHSDLTEHLDRELRQLDQYPPEDTDCIRLLMCKIKPFIWKMQNVVRDQIVRPASATDGPPSPTTSTSTSTSSSTTSTTSPPAAQVNGEEILKGIHANLPSEEEFQRQSAACEQQFRNCTRQP